MVYWIIYTVFLVCFRLWSEIAKNESLCDVWLCVYCYSFQLWGCAYIGQEEAWIWRTNILLCVQHTPVFLTGASHILVGLDVSHGSQTNQIKRRCQRRCQIWYVHPVSLPCRLFYSIFKLILLLIQTFLFILFIFFHMEIVCINKKNTFSTWTEQCLVRNLAF